MDPLTHALTGWLVGTACGGDARTRSLAMGAAIAPDFDWAPILWLGPVHEIHRTVGHNVWIGLPLAVALGLYCGNLLRSGAIVYVAFLSHLAWDMTFVDWPQRLLWPLSDAKFPTLAWEPFSFPHIASMFAVLLATVIAMLVTGFSPMEAFPRFLRPQIEWDAEPKNSADAKERRR